ncbi:MAG: M43 family zinc metalloprotease [Bacteroidia bacterium]|nr:M43 family zinc metalloprotease [Bacteroidia bacterium]MDW8158881.1 M43 family zinc metalloprotease [Bacteroidia bacterium]
MYIFFCYLGVKFTNAQKNTPCFTDEYHALQIAKDPSLVKEIENFEKEIQNRIQKNKFYKIQSDFLKTRYVIPCVVHVIHNRDIAPQDTASIIQQIESQFDALFNDYRKVPGTNGIGAGVDMEIEFTLATKDPQGKPTKGINFIKNSALADLEPATEDIELKRTNVWPRNKYLNIWLVDKIGNDPQRPTLGYAQFPSFPPGTDGVVIRRDCFGTKGRIGGPGGSNDLGRTATHELGHWLNLFHPFQGGCGNTSCLNSGDQICDTPPTAEDNYGLGLERKNTCTNDTPDIPDNPRNYMDYLDDAGLNYFSQGQKARALATLESRNFMQRYNLWQESNLRETGVGKYKAPVANFFANNRFTCTGVPVTFIDYSTNQPTEYRWEFPGGTPTTSTEANPKVIYNTPGIYDVQLTVSNLSGQSHTITKKAFIQVIAETKSLPFTEGFGAITFPPAGWYIENPDSAAALKALTWTWRRLATRGGFGRSQGCATMPCFKYSDYNQIDGLRTPPLDLSKVDAAHLTFSIAYLPYNFSYASNKSILLGDTLSVLASTDCGATWQTLYKKGGLQLSKVGKPVNVEINLPENNDWRTDTVRLDKVIGNNRVVLKFEVKNNFGNNIFIDDIVVERTTPLSLTPPILVHPPVVAPNPTQNNTQVFYHLLQPQKCSYEVINIQGKIIFASSPTYCETGEHSVNIPLPSKGVYIVSINIGEQKFYSKVVCY